MLVSAVLILGLHRQGCLHESHLLGMSRVATQSHSTDLPDSLSVVVDLLQVVPKLHLDVCSSLKVEKEQFVQLLDLEQVGVEYLLRWPFSIGLEINSTRYIPHSHFPLQANGLCGNCCPALRTFTNCSKGISLRRICVNPF